MKTKPGVRVYVADGGGGMIRVDDRRFDTGSWPIRFVVPPSEADDWFAHLQAERGTRKWSLRGLGQIHAEENSGTLYLTSGIAGRSSEIIITWERSPASGVSVRARPSGTPEMPLEEAQRFFDAVNKRSAERVRETYYRRGQLLYEGLPWRGEVWLDKSVRLGPPSKHASFLLAPQVIILDAQIKGIGAGGANSEFDRLLREVATFLTVVLGPAVRVPESGHAWTVVTNDDGKADTKLSALGYWESERPSEMPPPGAARAMPTRSVDRLDEEQQGNQGGETEKSIPDDLVDLWSAFRNLSKDRRQQFLGAGRALQISRSLWPDHETACFVFKVVACESLKPSGRKFDRWNVYDVIESLLGKPQADRLRELRFPAHRVRNQHLHRAELFGAELDLRFMMSSFQDPSFYDAQGLLSLLARAAAVEWLRRGGL